MGEMGDGGQGGFDKCQLFKASLNKEGSLSPGELKLFPQPTQKVSFGLITLIFSIKLNQTPD